MFLKRNNKGFTTVYLVMILSSLVMAVVMIINAACGFAARSVVDSVSALAGRSVLSEYQKDLYERYGIFALRADDAMLSRLSAFYINGSLVTPKALVSPVAASVKASAESYPALDTKNFGQQVKRLAPAAAVMKGRVLEYLSRFIGHGSSAGSVFNSLNEGDHVEDSSGAAEKSFGRDKDRSRGNKIPNKDFKKLPSKLLGYPKRISLLLSGGITDLSFSTIAEDEYIMAMCSNAVHTREDTYLELEAEYILYGNASDAANLKALKLSLFALRFAVNEIKYLSETGEVLVSTAASVALAADEVRRLLAGQSVDDLDYDVYLRILLALVPRNEKLARLMDVMQINITIKDGANFAFKNYAYGFDLNASFLMKRRTGDVSMAFVYK